MTEDAITIRRGYPPQAHRVIAVGYDGVLFDPDPIPGAPEALRKLRERGYRIIISTSRMSASWLEQSGHAAAEMRGRIEDSLTRHGIPFDGITGEKIAAQWYVDDRSLRFDGDWPPIVDFILWSDAA